MINSCFMPEDPEALMTGRREGVANGKAVSLGEMTPSGMLPAVTNLTIGIVSRDDGRHDPTLDRALPPSRHRRNSRRP